MQVRHAVQLDTGQLVICHGASCQSAVSIIDADGHLITTTHHHDDDDDDSEPLGWTTQLAVDSPQKRGGGEGYIYVADYSNKRVVQLRPSDLTHVGDIVNYRAHGVRSPRNICLDSTARRLYVAEASGNVTVFGLVQSTDYAN